jgi:hypothetical protein
MRFDRRPDQILHTSIIMKQSEPSLQNPGWENRGSRRKIAAVNAARVNRRTFLRAAFGTSALALSGCVSPESSTVPAPAMLSAGGPTAGDSPRAGGAIDTHIHLVHGNPDLKPIPAEMEQLTQSAPEIRARRLKMEMEQANISLAFAMGRREGPADDPLGINSSLEVASLLPGIRVIGIIDPRRSGRAHLRQYERQIDSHRDQLVGFKAYLGYLHFSPADPGYRPFYKLAAKYNLPVIFHTGDTWSYKAKVKFAHPLGVDEVAVDHAEVRFVMAHWGNPWLLDASEVISKNDNVWGDLSGFYVGDEKGLNELLRIQPPPSFLSDIQKSLASAQRWDRLI